MCKPALSVLLTDIESAIKRTRMVVVERLRTFKKEGIIYCARRMLHGVFITSSVFSFFSFLHLIATCEVIGDLPNERVIGGTSFENN